MKKSVNLIVRVDPELKNIIDKKAEEQEITTSELVREILSLVFLVDYENLKFRKYVIERLQENKKVLNQIINNPLSKEGDKQKVLAKKNLELCIELEEVFAKNISTK